MPLPIFEWRGPDRPGMVLVSAMWQRRISTRAALSGRPGPAGRGVKVLWPPSAHPPPATAATGPAAVRAGGRSRALPRHGLIYDEMILHCSQKRGLPSSNGLHINVTLC